jgi:DNA-directed RNA polymerase subunit F
MAEPLPLAQVKELLASEAARRTLPREAALALQHAELFARLTPEATVKLVAALKGLSFLDTALAVKIADILPQYPEEIRLLFSKERIPVDEAQITQVLEIVAQHR